MKGRFLPPLYFAWVAFCFWIALNMIFYWYGYTGPWIDRILVFGIWLMSTVTWITVLFKTPRDKWTRRGVGIFGFMLGASVLSTMSQLNEWGFFPGGHLPQWAINTYRSLLFLASPLIVYGYIKYFQGDSWSRDPPDHPSP
jgi:hypothetical protein